MIGGADGIDPGLRARADLAISFGLYGPAHMLVRVMLAEQLYRAATILAGSPYHRGRRPAGVATTAPLRCEVQISAG